MNIFFCFLSFLLSDITEHLEEVLEEVITKDDPPGENNIINSKAKELNKNLLVAENKHENQALEQNKENLDDNLNTVKEGDQNKEQKEIQDNKAGNQKQNDSTNNSEVAEISKENNIDDPTKNLSKNEKENNKEKCTNESNKKLQTPPEHKENSDDHQINKNTIITENKKPDISSNTCQNEVKPESKDNQPKETENNEIKKHDISSCTCQNKVTPENKDNQPKETEINANKQFCEKSKEDTKPQEKVIEPEKDKDCDKCKEINEHLKEKVNEDEIKKQENKETLINTTNNEEPNKFKNVKADANDNKNLKNDETDQKDINTEKCKQEDKNENVNFKCKAGEKKIESESKDTKQDNEKNVCKDNKRDNENSESKDTNQNNKNSECKNNKRDNENSEFKDTNQNNKNSEGKDSKQDNAKLESKDNEKKECKDNKQDNEKPEYKENKKEILDQNKNTSPDNNTDLKDQKSTIGKIEIKDGTNKTDITNMQPKNESTDKEGGENKSSNISQEKPDGKDNLEINKSKEDDIKKCPEIQTNPNKGTENNIEQNISKEKINNKLEKNELKKDEKEVNKEIIDENKDKKDNSDMMPFTKEEKPKLPKNANSLKDSSETQHSNEKESAPDNKNESDTKKNQKDKIENSTKDASEKEKEMKRKTETVANIVKQITEETKSNEIAKTENKQLQCDKKKDDQPKTDKKEPAKNQEKKEPDSNEKEDIKASDIGNIDLERIKEHLKDAEKYEHDFASVQGGVHILNTITKNIEFLKDKLKYKKSIGKIKGILIYKKDNEYTDYWNVLKFHKENDKFIDETGYFEGILCDSFEKIPQEGVLTPNGFYQSKKLSSGELGAQFTSIKLLIEEISHAQKKSIPDLFKENNDISILDRLIFAHSYKEMLRNRIINKNYERVCICNDPFCKEPCKEFRWVRKEYLK